ncbi:MutH/Sau3AI family endonuclease [Metasolibacillus meyeri]|uniref:MutH/Sau3AI family endonuclease n=1 Tax=Metasolibacillus meyeri TaxID=1071052 RepID=UPI000D316456|nr:MutH/Sau3AI family endonuclease [Metasolibacillus meyeri]
MTGFEISRKKLINIFDNVIGKTLGEVDSKNVFQRTIKNPKITGIAGDIIEQSVVGYPSDSRQSPDLIVDGIETELKTTGIRKSKKKNDNRFEAKEPMTITAVSPERIIYEKFETSSFWHKLENLLLVYYNYDSEQTVPAARYADFVLEGYHFYQFSDEDRERLKNDWVLVRDFLLQLEETENPVEGYPNLSSALRKDLMLIDTSPKWPNRPRFRLKRSTVTTIVQGYFGEQLEKLDKSYTTFQEVDDKLQELTRVHQGKSIKQLIKELGLPLNLNKSRDVQKAITEQIVVKMFDGNASKMNQIELFKKIGLIPKSVTQTVKGTRTEDMKLLKIDFGEWTDESISFEESSVFSYFNDYQLLCILFEEPDNSAKLLDNKFIGFKRLIIPDYIVDTDVRETWNKVRHLINNNELKESRLYNKNGELLINPKTKLTKTSINFPKSKDFLFFVRGSGTDSSAKTLQVNGIQMYTQYLWMKGSVLLGMLEDIDYI